jgi:hypothetical protein
MVVTGRNARHQIRIVHPARLCAASGRSR